VLLCVPAVPPFCLNGSNPCLQPLNLFVTGWPGDPIDRPRLLNKQRLCEVIGRPQAAPMIWPKVSKSVEDTMQSCAAICKKNGELWTCCFKLCLVLLHCSLSEFRWQNVPVEAEVLNIDKWNELYYNKKPTVFPSYS